MPAIKGDPPKCAIHHGKRFGVPEAIDRTVGADEIDGARRFLSTWLPGVSGAHRGSSVCLYTNTPDEHFVIGAHPAHANVIVAGGFSGHGFKFCSVVGEILAGLAMDGTTKHPIALFEPRRFAARA
jgi:sarcosine oxidase